MPSGLRSTCQRFFAQQQQRRHSRFLDLGRCSFHAAGISRSPSALAHRLDTPKLNSHVPPIFLTHDKAREQELHQRFGGPKAGDTIVLAMSGGVDSSLCASLLRSSPLNFDLRGVYMRNWNTLDESSNFEPGSGGASGCEWQREWKDVQAVCEHLGGIPLQMKDLSKEYWTSVFEPALDCWAEGRTPNPDVSCNREIKFGALVKVLFQDGDPELKQRAADGKAWLATGHYAGIRWERDERGRPRPRLTRCKDENKDQSYYLSSVSEEALALAHFPLTNMLKAQVKAMAQEHRLPTADREESMGLCFVGERRRPLSPPTPSSQHANAQTAGLPAAGLASAGFSAFLESYLPATADAGSSSGLQSGPIIHLETGKQLGVHHGLHTLTIGQNARIPGAKAKLFVARKDSAYAPSSGRSSRPAVYVVEGREHDALMCERLSVAPGTFHWIGKPPSGLLGNAKTNGERSGSIRALAQVRHRQQQVLCAVSLGPAPADDDCQSLSSESSTHPVRVRFDSPVDAVAPGQVVALWDDEGVTLGSGVVDSTATVWDRKHEEGAQVTSAA